MNEIGHAVALVTGANRGIGFEVCRQLAERGWTVLLAARDREKGEEAVERIAGGRHRVLPVRLDVTDPESIDEVRASVEADFGRLDVLVNNAAILYDSWQRPSTADLEVVREAFETNLFGAWRVCQAFIPLLRGSAHGRVVNVSSESGSLAVMGAGTPAYSASKAALNALTRLLAAELADARILVNAVCPGWTATEMGGEGGRPIEDGAASVTWAALLPDDGPSGGFFRDGQPLRW
jgi:NAD(P)-dependent dehydrogenase (short-subunit alcohol dehydrogenase family)